MNMKKIKETKQVNEEEIVKNITKDKIRLGT